MRKIILLTALFSIITLPFIVLGQGLLPECARGKQEGNNICTICDIVSTAIYIFKWIMGLLGGATLLLFVWHGFSLIISGGQSEKIEKAKTGLVSTLIGLAIVFGSWMIVNVIIVVLASPPGGLTADGIGTVFTGQKNVEKVWNAEIYCK